MTQMSSDEGRRFRRGAGLRAAVKGGIELDEILGMFAVANLRRRCIPPQQSALLKSCAAPPCPRLAVSGGGALRPHWAINGSGMRGKALRAVYKSV